MNIPVDAAELKRIRLYLLEQIGVASDGHLRRIEAVQENWRRFVGRASALPAAESHLPNRLLPLVQQATMRKTAEIWASMMSPGFGARATAHTPEMAEAAEKVGMATAFYLRNAPDVEREAALHITRKTLHGSAVACIDMCRKSYTHRHLAFTPSGEIAERQDEEQLTYIGPRFRSLNPRDIIWPDEPDAMHMEDYSWVCEILHDVSMDSLMRGEDEGRYFGIRKNWRRILGMGQDAEHDWTFLEHVDDAEQGFTRTAETSSEEKSAVANTINVWRVYFRWRLPEGSAKRRPKRIESELEQWAADRGMSGGALFPIDRQTPMVELVAHIIPGADLIIGLWDAADQFPNQEQRRPYYRHNMIETGRSIGLGLGQILANFEDDSSSLWRYFLYSAAMGAGPTVFYAPGSGFNPKKHRVLPFGATVVKDPNLIRMETMTGNPAPLLEGIQRLDLEGQRLTGLNDFRMGMPGTMPGQPETLGGQRLVMGAAEIRSALDLGMERQGWSQVARRFWSILCSPYMPPEVMFRTLGEQPQTFAMNNGFGYLSSAERKGRFDFTLTYAEGPVEKQEKAQRLQAVTAAILPLPVVQTQPQLQAAIARKMLEDAGFEDLAKQIQAPAVDMPRQPAEEERDMQLGKTVLVHPMDDDIAHLHGVAGAGAGHQQTLKDWEAAEFPNTVAIQRLLDHIALHVKQMQEKRMAVGMMGAALDETAGPLQPPVQPEQTVQ